MYTMPGYYQPTHPLTRLVCSTRDPPIRAPYARTWPRCRRRNDNRSRSISGDESVNVSTYCPSIWWVPNWRAHKPTNYYGRIHYIYYCIVSYRFFYNDQSQHSTKQNSRLWWQYAFKCVTRCASSSDTSFAIWNPNLKFQLHCKRQLRIRKLRRVKWSNREPLRLHITDIQLICQVRRYSK